MTKLLTEAFEEASRLPEGLQDQLARDLLDELAWESRWEKTLAESRSKVDQLAEKALAEHKAGRTKEAGFDELWNRTSRRTSWRALGICRTASSASPARTTGCGRWIRIIRAFGSDVWGGSTRLLRARGHRLEGPRGQAGRHDGLVLDRTPRRIRQAAQRIVGSV